MFLFLFEIRTLHSVGRFEESQKRLREIAENKKKDPYLIDFAFENENSVKSESISNVSVEFGEEKKLKLSFLLLSLE